jgi:hypothetical protein
VVFRTERDIVSPNNFIHLQETVSMAGSCRILLGVVFVSILTTSTASAFNGRFGFWRSPPTASNYYAMPSPYWCPPGPTGPAVFPVPDARPMPMQYAPATPAPPSTPEPPIKKASNDPRMPMIVTSHAPSGGAVQARPLAKDRCRVGFWNLSGRDVSLTIDGKTTLLPKDRAITVDLERQFTWQVEGRPPHSERLPEGKTTHEVVIQE